MLYVIAVTHDLTLYVRPYDRTFPHSVAGPYDTAAEALADMPAIQAQGIQGQLFFNVPATPAATLDVQP